MQRTVEADAQVSCLQMPPAETGGVIDQIRQAQCGSIRGQVTNAGSVDVNTILGGEGDLEFVLLPIEVAESIKPMRVGLRKKTGFVQSSAIQRGDGQGAGLASGGPGKTQVPLWRREGAGADEDDVFIGEILKHMTGEIFVAEGIDGDRLNIAS